MSSIQLDLSQLATEMIKTQYLDRVLFDAEFVITTNNVYMKLLNEHKRIYILPEYPHTDWIKQEKDIYEHKGGSVGVINVIAEAFNSKIGVEMINGSFVGIEAIYDDEMGMYIIKVPQSTFIVANIDRILQYHIKNITGVVINGKKEVYSEFGNIYLLPKIHSKNWKIIESFTDKLEFDDKIKYYYNINNKTLGITSSIPYYTIIINPYGLNMLNSGLTRLIAEFSVNRELYVRERAKISVDIVQKILEKSLTYDLKTMPAGSYTMLENDNIAIQIMCYKNIPNHIIEDALNSLNSFQSSVKLMFDIENNTRYICVIRAESESE